MRSRLTKITSWQPGFAVLILLIYLATRLYQLLAFPAFIDEVDHVSWARDIYSLHLFTGATNGKLFGLWWVSLFDLSGDSSLFVARAATILFQMLTVAGLLRLGREFGSKKAGYIAAVIYTLSPYAFFYDRLALMDPYVVGFAVLLTLFAVRATRTANPRYSIITGIMLFGAILAKATGVMLFVIPALALILPGKLSIRQRLWQTIITYGVFGLLWFPLYLVLMWRGYSYFSTAQSIVGTTESTNLVNRVWRNIAGADGIIAIDVRYHSMALVLVTVAAALIYTAHKRRQGLFLAAALVLPLGGLLLFATKLSARYFHFHIAFAYVLLALGLWRAGRILAAHFRLPALSLPVAALFIWGSLVSLPFFSQYVNDPAQLSLPRLDRLEYIEADSSGFAIPETVAYLRQAGAHEVIGWLSNCHTLEIYTHDETSVKCLPSKTDAATKAQQISYLNALVASDQTIWFVYEESAFTTLAGLSDQFVPVADIYRPGNRTHFTIFQTQGDAQS